MRSEELHHELVRRCPDAGGRGALIRAFDNCVGDFVADGEISLQKIRDHLDKAVPGWQDDRAKELRIAELFRRTALRECLLLAENITEEIAEGDVTLADLGRLSTKWSTYLGVQEHVRQAKNAELAPLP